jgi:ABC-type uncharacterized transport system fused permease/ATPase subunit
LTYRKDVLDRVNGNWDAVLNWEDILSLGEQQRVAIARLLYHEPSVAVSLYWRFYRNIVAGS